MQSLGYSSPSFAPRPKAVEPGLPFFAFDLDGTVTTEELLPRIASLAGKEREMAELTRQTLRGTIPFAESFRRRVAMLAHIPLKEVQDCVASVVLDPDISAFIRARKNDCAIVTGNLDIWVAPLLEKLGCRFFSSTGMIDNGKVRLLAVLDKADAALALCKTGRFIVAVGDSVSDVPFFERAHYGIAYAGVHEPVPKLVSIASRVAQNGRHLCSLLGLLEAGPCVYRSQIKEAPPCGG